MSRNKNIIVTFRPNSAEYKVLKIFSPDHRNSQSFYLNTVRFTQWLNNSDPWGSTYLEMDIHNVFRATHGINDKVEIRIYWLCADSDNGLRGYMQEFSMKASVLLDIMADEKERKVLVSTRRDSSQAKINVSSGAQSQIGKIITDKQKRRALSKALGSCFFYGSDETVDLYASWGSDFDFHNMGIYGGLVLHEVNIVGRDHQPHKKLYYGVHT